MTKKLLLTFALLLTAVTGAFAAYSGSCGDVSYSYVESTNTLTISGTGAMADYEDPSDQPWKDYRSSIKTVVISDGVTTIGKNAFNFSGLTSITIPASVTSIGKSAFNECSGLTSITIPANVTTIGDYAFASTGLTSIEIPASVTSIGEYAFTSCSGLTTVSFAAGSQLTTIGNYVFNSCSDLTSITIPARVTSIGNGVFAGCSNLATMTVEAGNTVYDSRNVCNAIIEKSTNTLIAGCKGTTIPTTVTSIGNAAFQFCNGLTSITIPASVTSIGEWAFIGCKTLATVTVYAPDCTLGVDAFLGCGNLTNIYVFSDFVNDYKDATNWSNYKDIITEIPNPNGNCGENVRWVLTGESPNYTLTITGTGAMADYEGPSDQPWIEYRSSIKTVVITSGVTSIGEGAFSSCEGLKSITIPASVTSIGQSAFGGCEGLTSITIPASVTTLNDAAFSGCTSLNTVFLYSVNPPTLGSDVFDGCTALDAIYVPAGTEETYKAADGWKAYASKILAIDGTCGNNVYYSYDSTSKTLNIFGTGAMANYSILNQWDIPWYDYSTDITTVVIADGVTSIGDYVFFDCTSLASITIPASVTTIGDFAFYDCIGLTSVTIPASVTTIGMYAFSGCTSLTSIEIPASVTSFGGGAFKDCTSLTSIEIPASVTSIGNEVFSYCTSLASISVAAGNTKYDSRNKCNAIIEKETNKLIVGCKNSVIPDDVTSIGNYAFKGCTDLTTITIPASVTSIGAGAFERCTSLTTIEIPASVTSIGAGAFTGCTSLANFKIPASVTSIGDYAFGDCTSLESITIPDGVTSIGDYAFSGCTPLTNITIPASVTSIGAGAFERCTSLTTIEIPASVTSIGGGAFRDCTSLNSVTIYAPELSEYGWRAFDGNANGRKIYVFESCMNYYKAKASRMSVSEDDIQPITDISLKDNDDNSTLIAAASGNAIAPLNVTLQDRTLYKDGDWNTLCLPFSVTVGNGVMADATAMTLNGSESGFDASTGVLTLNFVGVTSGNTIAAGTPFIVKWQKPDGYVAYNPATPEAECSDIVSPVFEGVTVSNAATTQTFGNGSFKGTYASITYEEENKSILFVGGENSLYWPTAGSSIGAQRAYFELNDGEMARNIVLNFEGENATGIHSTTNFTNCTNLAGAYYTLDGRKLAGKPSAPGIYVKDGHKVAIKREK